MKCSEASAADRKKGRDRQQLDLIIDRPNASSEPAGDQRWHVAAIKLDRCEELGSSIGVSTPEEVVSLFAANSMPLEFVRREEDLVLVREAGNPSDSGMAFARGLNNCLIVLSYLKASE
jgi:hypothetical protein